MLKSFSTTRIRSSSAERYSSFSLFFVTHLIALFREAVISPTGSCPLWRGFLLTPRSNFRCSNTVPISKCVSLLRLLWRQAKRIYRPDRQLDDPIEPVGIFFGERLNASADWLPSADSAVGRSANRSYGRYFPRNTTRPAPRTTPSEVASRIARRRLEVNKVWPWNLCDLLACARAGSARVLDLDENDQITKIWRR